MELIRTQVGPLVYYACSGFPGQVAHGFSTRLGGLSTGDQDSLNLIASKGDQPEAVAENYRRFHQALGIQTQVFVRNSQIHSDIIRPVTREDGYDLDQLVQGVGGFPQGDGLMTQEEGLALWVYSGDCVPLLFYDPVQKAVAAVHGGWRGTAQDIAGKTVEALGRAYGSRPEDLLVAIGPAIGPCCFSCHQDVTQALEGTYGQEISPFIRPQEGPEEKYGVDLVGIHRHALARRGVRHIATGAPCTGCHPQEFWSHRIMGDRRGSMGAVIALKPSPTPPSHC